jgi:predicted transcriptional regulator
MPRPKREITVSVVIYLRPAQITALDEKAEAENASRTEIIRKAIDKYLKPRD